jgi:hypothetical protein
VVLEVELAVTLVEVGVIEDVETGVLDNSVTLLLVLVVELEGLVEDEEAVELVEAGVDVLVTLVDVDVDTLVTLDDGAETM